MASLSLPLFGQENFANGTAVIFVVKFIQQRAHAAKSERIERNQFYFGQIKSSQIFKKSGKVSDRTNSSKLKRQKREFRLKSD